MRFDYDTKNDATTNAASTAMQVDGRKHMKLYKMISSTLYSDKFMSILRELCSNARDSHKEANKLAVPFAITAPTEAYPFLSIEDAGVGLDYEGAKPTVLTFLGSTKDEGDDADDYVGGWGIGAKSPRAYSSNYQIVCRKNGMEYVIQVYDKDGLPQHTLMLERKTDKKPGLEFIVPIEQKDIHVWRDKIKAYMEYTNYNVIAYMGDGEVKYATPPNASIDYEDGFSADIYGTVMKDNRGYASNANVTVTYGGMRYDLPHAMNLSDLVYKIKNELAYGIEMRIRVDNPNKLTFGLSRESIEVTDENTAFLRTALQQIVDDLLLSIKTSALKSKFVNGQNVKTWAELMEIDAVVRELSASEENGKFVAYTRRMSRSVYWDLSELKHRESQYIDYVSSVGKVFYGLPLKETDKVKPTIKVLWSKKRPMLRDWAGALSTHEMAVVLYEACSGEEGARKAMEIYRPIEGLPVEYVEVISTRGKRSFSGAGGNAGSKFAVCSHRGTRQKISDDKVYVTVDGPEQFWIENVMSKVVAFVPTKGFLSRETPDNVLTYEELMETPEYESMKKRLAGWHVSVDVRNQLRAAIRALERFSASEIPSSTADLVRKARNEVCSLNEQCASALEFLDKPVSTSSIPKDFTVDESITAALKEANAMLRILVVHSDLFAAIDFNLLENAIKLGNPEAKRLVCAMNLEQFV